MAGGMKVYNPCSCNDITILRKDQIHFSAKNCSIIIAQLHDHWPEMKALGSISCLKSQIIESISCLKHINFGNWVWSGYDVLVKVISL